MSSPGRCPGGGPQCLSPSLLLALPLSLVVSAPGSPGDGGTPWARGAERGAAPACGRAPRAARPGSWGSSPAGHNGPGSSSGASVCAPETRFCAWPPPGGPLCGGPGRPLLLLSGFLCRQPSPRCSPRYSPRVDRSPGGAGRPLLHCPAPPHLAQQADRRDPHRHYERPWSLPPRPLSKLLSLLYLFRVTTWGRFGSSAGVLGDGASLLSWQQGAPSASWLPKAGCPVPRGPPCPLVSRPGRGFSVLTGRHLPGGLPGPGPQCPRSESPASRWMGSQGGCCPRDERPRAQGASSSSPRDADGVARGLDCNKLLFNHCLCILILE